MPNYYECKSNNSIVSVISSYLENPDVMGAIQVGSSSHYYKDVKSDYDIEIIVTNEFYGSISKNNLVVRDFENKVEILFMSKDIFESKIKSSLNINHWPYVKGKIIYDKEGYIKKAISKIVEYGDDWEKRIKLSYFEFILLKSKINRIRETGEELNLKLVYAQLAIIAVNLIFVIEGKWTPIIYWTSQNILYLNDDHSTKELIFEMLTDPDLIIAEQLQAEIEGKLLKYGFDFFFDKELLTKEITTEAYVKIRERYSFF